jgi:membrane protease YdiL (CAAX protease family)
MRPGTLSADALFLMPNGRLRAPWRILLFIVALFIAVALAITLEAFLDSAALAAGYRPLVSEWGFALGAIIATAAMLFWLEHKSWDYVGLDSRAATPGLIARYTVLGVLAIAIPSLLLMAIGQLRAVPAAPGSWWAATGLTLANLLPAAAGEELLLRGYIFAVLREAIGWRWTLIATSIVFGLFHVPNPGADAESVLLVMLAGFFLGAVLLATRSLYAAIAAHFGWNWAMAAGLHTPVSGIPVLAPDYRVIDAGPDWLTGGGWGPEGGLAAAVSMFVVVVYIYARHLRRMEQ